VFFTLSKTFFSVNLSHSDIHNAVATLAATVNHIHLRNFLLPGFTSGIHSFSFGAVFTIKLVIN
jgi:hypothetical protein